MSHRKGIYATRTRLSSPGRLRLDLTIDITEVSWRGSAVCVTESSEVELRRRGLPLRQRWLAWLANGSFGSGLSRSPRISEASALAALRDGVRSACAVVSVYISLSMCVGR